MAASVRRVRAVLGPWAAPRTSSLHQGRNPYLSRFLLSSKQLPVHTFRLDARMFHAATPRALFRLRPFYFLVATGGGYAGYRQYENYRDRELERLGLEVPPRLAGEWENKWSCPI